MLIIVLSFWAIVVLNACLSELAFLYVLKIAGITLAIVFAIDAVVATVVHAVPEKKVNPFAKIFRVGKKERNFYNKLAIKKWKDVIPECGKFLCHFSKTSVQNPNSNEYVLKFLRETCYAGVMHFVSIFLGFAPLFFMPQKLSIVLPIALVNAFLQLLPVLVQRYNRERLTVVYEFNKRKEKANGAN